MISLKNKKYKEVTIDRIIDAGFRPTFDIEVKKNHHYLTEGEIVTHNTSIFANMVSSGIEPIFAPEYTRTAIITVTPKEIEHLTPRWNEGEFIETELFKFTKEGTDTLLRGEFNGTVYKIDKNRGLTKEILCQDYGVDYLKSIGEWNPNADWASTAGNLTAEDHLNDLKGFAKYIDSAISKCMSVENTMVILNDEIVYLNELGFGSEDTFTEFKAITKDHKGNTVDVVSLYNNGKKETIKITFDDFSSVI